jgi:ABC-2 type transport system ATP-binding protein
MNIIDARGLRKAYGDLQAVRGIDLQVTAGEVFCLLGPNGAGKTTTTEILEGYRTSSGGEVEVLGHDPAEPAGDLRARVGIVLQECGIQPELSVGELLAMYGRYYPWRRPIDELIELVGLDSKRDTRVRALSAGQRRRLDLALALVGDPELIFLDEPTTGFDPEARRRAWTTIADLARLGKTIFLTTHFMDEAQALADRVAVMVDGRIVDCAAPARLGGRDTAPSEVRFALPEGTVPGELPELGAGARVEQPTAGQVLVVAPDGVLATGALTAWALGRGLELRGFSVTQPSLEDVYLNLVTAGTPEEV